MLHLPHLLYPPACWSLGGQGAALCLETSFAEVRGSVECLGGNGVVGISLARTEGKRQTELFVFVPRSPVRLGLGVTAGRGLCCGVRPLLPPGSVPSASFSLQGCVQEGGSFAAALTLF